MTIKSNSNKTDYLVVNTTTAKTLIHYLSSKDLDSSSIQKQINYDLSEIDSPDSNLPLDIYKALWNLAAKYTEDPFLGLKLAQNPYNNEMSLVSHVFFNSQNLREGLKQYIRYYTLINQSISVQLNTKNDKAIVSYHCNNPANYCSPDIEHSLALSVTRIKEHISTDLSLDEVHFEHACHNLKLYEEFFGCPVYFNQKSTALIFKEKFLDYTFPKKSTHLFNFLTNHLELLLSKIKKNETLSDKVTQNKALVLLKKNQHTLSEIAFLLGFSELSSFSRAFKKWTGSSPANYIIK